VTRVLLTQPRPRVERLAARLTARGHEVLACPLRRLVGLGAEPGVREALGSLARHDWVIFVSPGSIEACAALLPQPWPASVGIAVIGPGSAQALAEHSTIPPDVRLVQPSGPPFDGQALLSTAPFDAPADLGILVLAGETGRTDWIDELARRGAHVERLAIYRSEAVAPAQETSSVLNRWASEPDPVVFVFTTGEAVRELDALVTGAGLGPWAHAQPALAPHPRIVSLLRERQWVSAHLVEPGERALLAAIESG